jgi:hypothetical protein
MLTITRDNGLCVIYASETRSTVELTLAEVRELLSHPVLTQLDTIRSELRAYESAEQTCERASERAQGVAAKCHRDPATDRTPKEPVP